MEKHFFLLSANFDFYNGSFQSHANTARQPHGDPSSSPHGFDCAKANECLYHC